MPDYSTSHTDPGKGVEYDNDFQISGLLRYLWHHEQVVLSAWLQTVEPEARCLDFAAGTGRIAEFLSRRFRSVVALDISEAMLRRIRDKNPSITTVHADFRSNPTGVLGQFDVVTAFRFFPNAEPMLRASALEFISNRMPVGGLLILNNHQNALSTSFRLGRLFAKPWAYRSLENEELIREVGRHGFTLESIEGFGVLPGTARRMFVPDAIHNLADYLARAVKADARWGQDAVMRFRRL